MTEWIGRVFTEYHDKLVIIDGKAIWDKLLAESALWGYVEFASR